MDTGSTFELIRDKQLWRIDFSAHELQIEVLNIRTGYRPSVLATSKDPELDLHRALTERFA